MLTWQSVWEVTWPNYDVMFAIGLKIHHGGCWFKNFAISFNTKFLENVNTCSLYFCLSFLILYLVKEVFLMRIWATIFIRLHRNHPLSFCGHTHCYSFRRLYRTIQHSGSWILHCILFGISTQLVQRMLWGAERFLINKGTRCAMSSLVHLFPSSDYSDRMKHW